MAVRRVPLHRSLFVRLLATSALIAVCAVVATAWLTMQLTTRTIRQEQGKVLADDTSVYTTLISYAATHRSWRGVDGTVTELAHRTGRRITLMTEKRETIVDSASGPSLRTARPSALVDPLRLDSGITGGSAGDIDPRVVGPYRLTASERQSLRKMAQDQVSCLGKTANLSAKIVELPNGRPRVTVARPGASAFFATCEIAGLVSPTRSEAGPLAELTERVAACLSTREPAGWSIAPDFSVRLTASLREGLTRGRILDCVDSSRREQLRPYTAPPALLFVTDPAVGSAEPAIELSRVNINRIAWVTTFVLAVTVAVTLFLGMRLIRPLRLLTEAASQPIDRQRPVPVAARDEIGHLASAFNDLAARRAELERQRKAMVSDVAHELRTPLTNIRNWLEAANDGVAPMEPQTVESLLEEAVLLQHVIDDLRDLAAADAGRLRVHPDMIFVNDVLAQVAEAHRSAAETARVRLLADPDGDPEVMVDPVRLRQMVGNLISNAVRHTPPDGTVTVLSRLVAGELVITVADTGAGIAPEDLPKVFDRFWRADRSRSRATGGSGLGLAIVRKLAEAHGGTIEAASEPGKGTAFTIRLPVPG